MHHLGDDDFGTWLWAPVGTTMRRGAEPPIVSTRRFVKLIARDQWWTAIWNEGGQIYVDVITPARWHGRTVHMVDMDLDVVRRADGAVTVEDEDEFEEHRAQFAYPNDIVERSRTVTAALAVDVERGVEPFGAIGEEWLARS